MNFDQFIKAQYVLTYPQINNRYNLTVNKLNWDEAFRVSLQLFPVMTCPMIIIAYSPGDKLDQNSVTKC